MRTILYRFVAFLLVPCLTVDPASAFGFNNTFINENSFSGSPDFSRYGQEALAAKLCVSQPGIHMGAVPGHDANARKRIPSHGAQPGRPKRNSGQRGHTRRFFGKTLVSALAIGGGLFGQEPKRKLKLGLGVSESDGKAFFDRYLKRLDDLIPIFEKTNSPENMKSIRLYREYLEQGAELIGTSSGRFEYALYYPGDQRVVIALDIPSMIELLDKSDKDPSGDATADLMRLAFKQGTLLQNFDAKKYDGFTEAGAKAIAKARPSVRYAYETWIRYTKKSGALLFHNLKGTDPLAAFQLSVPETKSTITSPFLTWVAQNWDQYQALQARIASGDTDSQLLLWALMVKEGRQAAFFEDYRRIHVEYFNLMASVHVPDFKLNDDDARKEVLKDKVRLEQAKHLVAREAYSESVGYEEFINFCRDLNLDSKFFNKMLDKETDPNIKALISALRDVIAVVESAGKDYRRALRIHILKVATLDLLTSVTLLTLAGEIESGRLKFDENKTIHLETPGALEWLLDPRYSDEDRHAEKRPEFSSLRPKTDDLNIAEIGRRELDSSTINYGGSHTGSWRDVFTEQGFLILSGVASLVVMTLLASFGIHGPPQYAVATAAGLLPLAFLVDPFVNLHQPRFAEVAANRNVTVEQYKIYLRGRFILFGLTTILATLFSPQLSFIAGQIAGMAIHAVNNLFFMPASHSSVDDTPLVLPMTPQQNFAEQPNAQGFVVGGVNSNETIDRLTGLTGKSIWTIESEARPGIESLISGGSLAGFLGPDDHFIDVLKEDNTYVRENGLTHQQLAEPLFYAMNILEHHAWPKTASISEEGPGLEYLYKGQRYRAQFAASRGIQKSLFNDGLSTSVDFTVTNMNTGSVIRFSGLIPYYVWRYGFYEGQTNYRVAPASIVQTFFTSQQSPIVQAQAGQPALLSKADEIERLEKIDIDILKTILPHLHFRITNLESLRALQNVEKRDASFDGLLADNRQVSWALDPVVLEFGKLIRNFKPLLLFESIWSGVSSENRDRILSVLTITINGTMLGSLEGFLKRLQYDPKIIHKIMATDSNALAKELLSRLALRLRDSSQLDKAA